HAARRARRADGAPRRGCRGAGARRDPPAARPGPDGPRRRAPPRPAGGGRRRRARRRGAAARRGGGPVSELWQAVRLLEVPRRRAVLAVLTGSAGLASAVGLAAVSAWLIARASQMPPVMYLTVATVAV